MVFQKSAGRLYFERLSYYPLSDMVFQISYRRRTGVSIQACSALENFGLFLLGVSCLGHCLAVSRGKAQSGLLHDGGIFTDVPSVGFAHGGLDCHQCQLYLGAGLRGVFPPRCSAGILREKDTCSFGGFIHTGRMLRSKYGADVCRASGGKFSGHFIFRI